MKKESGSLLEHWHQITMYFPFCRVWLCIFCTSYTACANPLMQGVLEWQLSLSLVLFPPFVSSFASIPLMLSPAFHIFLHLFLLFPLSVAHTYLNNSLIIQSHTLLVAPGAVYSKNDSKNCWMRGIFFNTVTWFILPVAVVPRQWCINYRSWVSVRVAEAG